MTDNGEVVELFSSGFTKVILQRADVPLGEQKKGVVFTFHGRGRGNAQSPWGGGFLASAGFDVVGFVDSANDWYQRFIEPEFLRNVLSTFDGFLDSHYPRRVCYGTSMGAYAALKLSYALSATHIVALSPPTKIKHHRLWTTDRAGEISELIPDDISENSCCLLAYDPMLKNAVRHGADDANCAARIAGIIGARGAEVIKLELPYYGHPVTAPLGKAKLLKSLFLGFVERGEVPVVIDSPAAMSSKRYMLSKLHALSISGEHREAVRFIKDNRKDIETDHHLRKLALHILDVSKLAPKLRHILMMKVQTDLA